MSSGQLHEREPLHCFCSPASLAGKRSDGGADQAFFILILFVMKKSDP